MTQYLHNPYKHSDRNPKTELDLSNYATRSDLKEATGVVYEI